MITLRELFDVTYDVTELEITARDDSTTFLHEWVFTPREVTAAQMMRDVEAGKLTVVMGKINVHGEPIRNGYPEIGWGVDLKKIPKPLLDAPITFLSMDTAYAIGGHHVRVDVEMQKTEVMMIVPGGE